MTDDPNAQERQGNADKLAAVEASTLEAAPKDQTDDQGSSFYSAALTGSGTILPDGTYGAPLPDPNLVKLQETATEVTEEAGPTEASPTVTRTGVSSMDEGSGSSSRKTSREK